MTARRLLAGLAACAAGCAAEPRSPSVASTDSSGVQLITGTLEDLPVRTADEVILTIGSVDGPADELFHLVRNPFLREDGTLVVPDGGSSQVRLYDLDGRRLDAFGTAGEGPGEFRNLMWVRPWPGDSLLSWDGELWRLTVHGPGFDGARTVRLAGDVEETAASAAQPGIRRIGGGQAPRAVDAFEDGTILGRTGEISVGPGDTTAVRRDTVAYHRFGADGARLATLARLPSSESFVWAEGGSRSAGSLPFGRTTAVATLAEGIVAADNAAFRVFWFDGDGRLRRISRVDVEPAPVEPADIEEHREGQLADLPGRFVEIRARALDATPFPATAPYHGNLVTGRERVWLERYRKPNEAAPPEWVVFDGTGVPRERVRLPVGFRLTAAHGDTLVGVRTDALDVEQVLVLRLARRTEGR